MNICIIGTGYVGLVTGACFAEMGNSVICVDIDSEKIQKLNLGEIPIYEPGLKEVVLRNSSEGRLIFTTDLNYGVQSSQFLFIAVGTPPGEDGSADLQYVLAVAAQIGTSLQSYAVIVDKSTVPIGTADKVRLTVQQALDKRQVSIEFDVVSNPEFLKEGVAVSDFMTPNRIVIGADSQRARDAITELYAPFNRSYPRTVFMGIRDAEMTKYAANAMLATKISFMNEIANLCERLGVDVENVRLGIGSDERIGFHFIYPGIGYGGSCFPKDVKALNYISNEIGFDSRLLQAVEYRNNQQKLRLFEKIVDYFSGNLKNKCFAVWGLAFKPGTDDMREAPSKVLIKALLDAGANVKAFDPIANESARAEFDQIHFDNGTLKIVDNAQLATRDADALILVTEWKQFRNVDYHELKNSLFRPLVFDGRNVYDPVQMAEHGFMYFGIGR